MASNILWDIRCVTVTASGSADNNRKKTSRQYCLVDQKTLPVGFGGCDFEDSGSQIQLQMLVNITTLTAQKFDNWFCLHITFKWNNVNSVKTLSKVCLISHWNGGADVKWSHWDLPSWPLVNSIWMVISICGLQGQCV